MPWNSLWPLGTVSVRANRITGQQNTTYIETELNKDHFWTIGVNENGHHRFTQMPKQQTAGVPTNPTLATGMDGVYYVKDKTAVEAPALQKAEPFHVSQIGATQHILQLGFRMMITFRGVGVPNPTQVAILYSHNVKPQDAVVANSGLQRIGVGVYAIRFQTVLPSANYLVLGTAQPFSTNDNDSLIVQVRPDTVIPSSYKSISEVHVSFVDDGGTRFDPLQAFVAVIGG